MCGHSHPVRGPPGRQRRLSREIGSLPVRPRPGWRVPAGSEQGRPNGTELGTAQTMPHHNLIKNNLRCTLTPPPIPQSLPVHGLLMCILGKSVCSEWNGCMDAPVNQMTSPCQSIKEVSPSQNVIKIKLDVIIFPCFLRKKNVCK